MEKNFVFLTAVSDYEVDIICQRLKNAGIEYLVRDSTANAWQRLYGGASLMGKEILVKVSDMAGAKELLGIKDNQPAISNKIKKRSLKIWVAVIFVFIVGGIFTWQYFSQQTEEVKDETADWKTYRNENYGFEISYPSIAVSVKDWANETPNMLLSVHFGGNSNIADNVISIYIERGTSINDLETAVSREDLFNNLLINPEDIKNVNIGFGDYSAKRVDYRSETLGLNFVKYLINYSGLLYQINYNRKVNNIMIEGDFNKMLSTIKFFRTNEIKNKNDSAVSFCDKEHGNLVSYLSPLNFDQDEDNELLVICGDSIITIRNKDFYILDKQNQDYKLIWQKNMPKNFYSDLNLYEIGKPEIVDVDGDMVDEIFFKGSIWGGTCTGSSDYYFLYSSKYNELFYLELRDQFDSTCTNILTSTKISGNLEIEKYKIFKDFLEQKYKIQ